MKHLASALDFIGESFAKLDKLDKLDVIEERLSKLEELLATKVTKDTADSKPVPQKAAMKELEVTFPTFKKLCMEFRVRPIKRNGRLFYKPSDISRMLNGQK